jgi:hypothetical protein
VAKGVRQYGLQEDGMNERSRMLTLVLTALSVLALVAFAACGGDDDDGGDSGGDTSPTATRTADDNGGGGDDDGDDGNGSDDPFADLDKLTEGLDTITGRISYRITDTDGSESSFTVYSDGTNTRYDSVDDSGSTSIFITTSDTSYTCDTESETCFSYGEGSPGGGINFFTAFLGSGAVGVYVAAARAAGVDIDTSSERHAGTDAQCFSWSDDADIGTGKMCFAEGNGVLLYQETVDDDGTFKLEATEFSSSVSDSDFEPPYPVTTIPGG